MLCPWRGLDAVARSLNPCKRDPNSLDTRPRMSEWLAVDWSPEFSATTINIHTLLEFHNSILSGGIVEFL